MVTKASKLPKIVTLLCDFALSPTFHEVGNRQKSSFRHENARGSRKRPQHSLGSAKHNIFSIYVPGKKWSQRPQNRQKSSFYTVILHYLPICTESRTGKNQILDLKTLAEVENDLNTTWEVQNITYCPYMFLVKSGHKHLKNAKNRFFSKIVGVGLSSQEFTADFQNSQ